MVDISWSHDGGERSGPVGSSWSSPRKLEYVNPMLTSSINILVYMES